MTSYPSLRRWLSTAVTAVVFATLLVVVAWTGRSGSGPSAQADQTKGAGAREWPLFGGTVARNLVNTFEHGIPDNWDAASGKNIKWSADLGSKAYGGPIVVGGKIFIGTNND